MSNVTIDITIRSQGATSGAQKTKQALKQVEDSAQKTAKAVERSNKALNDTKTVNTAHSAMGGLSTRLQRLGRNFKDAAKDTNTLSRRFDDLSRSVRLVDGPLGGVAARMQTIGGILKFVNPGMVFFTLGAAGAAAAAKTLARSSLELEKQLFKVGAGLEVAGLQSKISVEQIENISEEFGLLTLSSKQAGLAMASAVLSFGGDILGDAPVQRLRDLQVAAQGVTSVFGGDALANIRRFARALQDPTRAGRVLRETIGSLSKEKAAYIELIAEGESQFIQEGDTIREVTGAELARIEVLKEVNKFQKFAIAEAQGYAGSLDTLSEKATNLATQFNQVAGVTGLFGAALDALSNVLGSVESNLDGTETRTGQLFETFGLLQGAALTLGTGLAQIAIALNNIGNNWSEIFFADGAELERLLEKAWNDAAETTRKGVDRLIAERERAREAFERKELAARLGISLESDTDKQTEVERLGLTDKLLDKIIKKEQKRVEAVKDKLANLEKGREFYEAEAREQAARAKAEEEINKIFSANNPKRLEAIEKRTKIELERLEKQDRLTKQISQNRLAEEQAKLRQEKGRQRIDQSTLELQNARDRLEAIKRGREESEKQLDTNKERLEIARLTTGLSEKDAQKVAENVRQKFEILRAETEIKNQLEEQDRIEKDLERQRSRRQREREREARRSYRQLERDFSNAVEQGLRGGAESGFRSILEQAENTLYRELATGIARSVLAGFSVTGGLVLPGAAGAASGGDGSVLGQISTLSNLSSLTNIGQSLTSTALPDGLARSVDSFGRSVFGIDTVTPIQGPTLPGVYGPAPNGVVITDGLSESFNLANIGAGVAGSFAASALFGEGTGTSVGSTVGGLGAGLLAAGAGPLGAAAAIFGGSFLGGGLGSLFGNSEPSSRLQSGFIDLSTGQLTGRGGLRGDKFSQENQNLVDSLAQVSASLAETFGISNQQLAVAASDRYGLEFALSDDPRVFDFDNEARQQFDTANQFFEALTSAFAEQASEDISEKTQNALKRLDFGEGEEALQTALSDVVFAVNFEKIFEEPVNESLSQVEQQVKTLNETFDQYTVAAKRLGFAQEDINRLEERRVELAEEYIDSFIKQRQSTTQAEQAIEQINEAFDALTAATEESRLGVDKLAEVERARAKGLQDLTKGFESGVGASILEIISPRTNALVTEGQRYRAQIREAEALGADLRQVELLHKLNLLEIEREYGTELESNGEKAVQNARDVESLINGYERLVQSLDDALFDLRIGQNSTLSPSQKLAQAESRFLSLRDAALGGDLDAAGQLASVGNEFLTLSRQYSAITEDFVADFQLVERTLEETKSFAITELDVQRGILATLETGFADMINALGGVSGILGINENVDVFTQANSNAAGRSLQETAIYGLSVGQIEAVGRDLLGGYTGATGSGELNRLLAERGLTETFGQSLRNLAGFANGGITPTNQPFIVGERGPEIMSFNTSARVTPIDADASRQIAEGNRLASQQVETLQRGFAVLADQMEAMIAAQQMANANAQVSRIRKAPK